MLPMHFKVGFVTVLSCLTLLLGLLSPTSVALANSGQAHQVQTSASVSTPDPCRRIFVRRFDRFHHFHRFDDRDFGFFRFVCFHRPFHHFHHFGFGDDGF